MNLMMENYFRLAEYMRSGGVVMLPLALVSIAMWLLIIDRVLFFRRLQYKPMRTQIALDHIKADRMPDPKQYRGAISLLVATFLSRRSADPELDRFILDETVLQLNRSLTAYLNIIGALAGIAPLLGLLGTVTGMIATFDILAVFGTGNAKAMAGGISEALITTQTGLLVAIPGLYMKGLLDRRARVLKQRIASVGYCLWRQL